MANYLLQNIVVYKGENKRGPFYWATAELTDPEDPFNDPSRARIYPMLNPRLVDVYRKVATPDPTDTSHTRATVDVAKLRAAKEAGKFADGTPYPSREMPDGSMFKFDFELVKNVFPHDVPLTRPHLRIATRNVDVKVNGVTRTITAGNPIPGRNGEFIPVNTIRVYIKHDGDGNPIEQPEDAVNRILERRYRPLNATSETAGPAQAPAEVQVPEEQQQAAAAQAAAEAAALGNAF